MAQEDACTLLDQEHIQVERLFERYKSAAEPARKRLLAQEIRHDLALHMMLEDELFYPAFREATGDHGRVDESTREHQQLRDMITRLDLPHTDDKLMLDLEDAVMRHVDEEREEMFPAARKANKLDLMQLADRLEARKAELLALHPA